MIVYRLTISPWASLKIPPAPLGPGFPLEASLKFNFRKPWGGFPCLYVKWMQFMVIFLWERILPFVEVPYG
jgi:hypothetical protein